MNDLLEFVAWVGALWVLTYVGAALGAGSGPTTQLFVLVPGFVLALPVAYWLVYRDGLARLQ